MLTVNARAIAGPGESFKPIEIERRDLGPHDILIDIVYSGICHSDVHRVNGQAGAVTYPMVPGHEIAGRVSAVGSDVTKYKVGDHAGIGCMVDSCRECDRCKSGNQQFCRKEWIRTYNWVGHDGERTQGGYSEKIVVDENYAIRIPEAMPLDKAAPMLCAGITMYSPLKKWRVGPGTRVAFLGFGGLGHIGVQIAKAMGARVTVLELTLDKKEAGLELGADEYIATTEEGALDGLKESFDVIVSTVPASVALDPYLALLDLDGVFVFVGQAQKPLSFAVGSLKTDRRALAGTVIGGIPETQEMMDFCAEHGVGAVVEVIDADRIDEAFERVAAGDVKFRFVIDVATMAIS
jgi:uncharacterized zinc-type alcohol dehydrogenase-like protein